MAYNSHQEGVYLRVKRKREEEPATHMFAEITLPGAKKMREQSFVPGVFTYAETVEDSSVFDDSQYLDALNKRVITMSHPPVQPTQTEGSPMSVSMPSGTDLPSLGRTHSTSPTKTGARSYTIVPQPGAPAAPPPPQRIPSRPTAPPVVRSSASVPPPPPPTVTFYEAIESNQNPDTPPSDDAAMESFASMVNDYLTLNNIPLDEPPRPVTPAPPQHAELVSPAKDKGKAVIPDDQEDYVYDVFYFALKDVNDVNELIAREAANIATLRGLPFWEFTDLTPDDGSDDSAKDEADEDSNDEDYYRNDYPDEDEAVSDDEGEIESGWKHWQY